MGGAKEEDNYSSIKYDLVSWNSEPVKSTQIPFIIILGTHIPLMNLSNTFHQINLKYKANNTH